VERLCRDKHPSLVGFFVGDKEEKSFGALTVGDCQKGKK